jgi:iron complex transport system permease protein
VSALISDVGPGLVAVRAHVRHRRWIVTTSLAVALVVVVVVGLSVGDYPLSPDQLWRTLWGGGERVESYVLFQVRAPRVFMGALVGACLAIAGALLQTLLRNSLASPDLLGITGGSSVGALFVLLVLGVTGPVLVLAAFGGGIVVALLLLFAGGRTGEGGFRLILAGIGVSFLAVAITNFLMVRAQVELAKSALLWTIGSLGATAWWQVLALIMVGLVALPGVFLAARWLPITQLGAATSAGLGVHPATVRWVAVGSAVLLTAACCAFTGPISFVALCAPPIARALLGHGAIGVAASGLVGAVLLTVADLLAQFALPGLSLPVGVVTGAVGAVFLLWLLASTKGRQL